MFTRFFLAIVALISLCAVDGAAFAAEGGSLAVVWQHGRDLHGFSSSGSRAENRKSALRKCGDSRCEIAQEYKKGQCAVLVLGRKQIFWNGNGRTADVKQFTPKETVRRNLVAFCSKIDDDCRVILSECY